MNAHSLYVYEFKTCNIYLKFKYHNYFIRIIALYQILLSLVLGNLIFVVSLFNRAFKIFVLSIIVSGSYIHIYNYTLYIIIIINNNTINITYANLRQQYYTIILLSVAIPMSSLTISFILQISFSKIVSEPYKIVVQHTRAVVFNII